MARIKKSELAYPLNCIVDGVLYSVDELEFMSEEKRQKRDADIAALSYPTLEATFEYVLQAMMNEQERTVVHLYYKEDMNMSEVGRGMSLSASRISQLVCQVRRRLSSPSRMNIIRKGIGEYFTKKMQEACKNASDEAYKRGYTAGYEAGFAAAKTGAPVSTVLPEKPIEELTLSVRLFNALKRGGINTLQEIAYTPPKSLMKRRNFGKGCLRETIKLLREYGVDTTEHEALLNECEAE